VSDLDKGINEASKALFGKDIETVLKDIGAE